MTGDTLIVATEPHIIHQMQLAMPNKLFIGAPGADGNCKFSREGQDSFVWWIDEDIKKETLEAMRVGRSFGEKSRVFDQYQDKP